MTIAPPTLITGAARTALPYGLFSTFSFRPNGDRWEGGVAFETLSCEPVDGIGAFNCDPPTAEVVTVTRAAGVTAFTLTYGGQTTASITSAATATASSVQSALEALSTIDPGDLTVSGANGGPWTVTWAEPGNRTALTATGTGGTVTVAVTTEGVDYTLGLPKNLRGGGPIGDVGEASQFTVYGHYNCAPMSDSFAAAQAKAEDHLRAREEARVEQAFWTGDLGNDPNLVESATAIQPGAVKANVGLALLEDFIADNYGSLGVVHMSRKMASALTGSQLTSSGARLLTKLGTPVVAGTGYPGTGPSGGAAPTLTTEWVMVSPALFGYRSDVFTSSTVPGDLLDRRTNDLMAVAERNYLIGFDPCGVGAVLIDLAA